MFNKLKEEVKVTKLEMKLIFASFVMLWLNLELMGFFK